MTWKMLARDSARTLLILPTLASITMIAVLEVGHRPTTVLANLRQMPEITTPGESSETVQGAARFMQSLTKLYRPGRAGVLGRLLMQYLRNLLRSSRERLQRVGRHIRQKMGARLPGQAFRPAQKLTRWLSRRRAPDDGQS